MAGALGRRSLTTTPAAWAMPQTLTATVFLVWASSISSSSAAALYYSLQVSHFVFASYTSPIFLASILASRDFTVIQTIVCSLTLQTNVLARLAMTSTAWALPSTTTEEEGVVLTSIKTLPCRSRSWEKSLHHSLKNLTPFPIPDGYDTPPFSTSAAPPRAPLCTPCKSVRALIV